jgi:uncharacterized protein YdaT
MIEETKIADDTKPRFLTKFEEESLKEWFYNEGDFEEINAEAFKEWYEEMSWIEIDEIMTHYTMTDNSIDNE